MYYPAMLNLRNKKCSVIGGGLVALRKCITLLECEASIKVVSLTFRKEFSEFDPARVLLIRDVFRTQYIEDCFIVIAATEDKELNKEIYNYCEENRILINVVDEPELCSFIVPAYLRRGDLTISVSTGGKSPALARKIKEDIAVSYPAEYAQYVEIMGLIRVEILKKGHSLQERMKILAELSHLPSDELSEYYKNIRS
jgi:precorrin-2 dehydrogenase/sirohydrochlorin ferrochelatase